MPVKAAAFVAGGRTGYASATRPPAARMLRSAWRRSARETPWPRKLAFTKKHGMLQIPAASGEASDFERWSLDRSLLRA